MTEINSLTNKRFDVTAKEIKNLPDEDINLENISILYTTRNTEDFRTTFDESFKEKKIKKTDGGELFLQGLTENKKELKQRLGLNEAEYNTLACMSLALASQETGFGEESGYKSENEGLGKKIRDLAKKVDVQKGGGSASSGLTQIKIHDFLNGGLSDENKSILKDFGIESSDSMTNNLYENPDKSAIATMVILSSLYSSYDNYTDNMKKAHKEINEKLDDNLSDDEKLAKGQELMDNISSIYFNATEEDKDYIRTTLKQCFLAIDGSTIDDTGQDLYNEEKQLSGLNLYLMKNSYKSIFTADDLNYLKYLLTSEGQELSQVEYCAYAWNKGTGASGMQTDRILAEKIGTILKADGDFDYDQYCANVTDLTAKYMTQAGASFDTES